MTAQFSETIHYEGQQTSMCSNPLSDYFLITGIDPKFEECCTALWRRYIGTWEIIDDRLYLIGLIGNVDGVPPTSTEHLLPGKLSLEVFFPGFPDRVFAHWYSGTLRLPQGEMLKYVHMGYGTSYERDLFVDIEKGVVIKTYLKQNRAPTAPYVQKWYEFAKRKKQA